MIQVYWFLITLIMFIWASIEDVKTRIVQDRVWLILMLLALPTYIYWLNEIATEDEKLLSIINILFSIFVGIAVFIFGLGGGDSKAIMVISLTTPVTMENFYFPLINFYPVLSILAILVIFQTYFVLFALSLVIRNIIEIRRFGNLFEFTEGSKMKKVLTLMAARRVSKSDFAYLKHSDPAEIYLDYKWILYTPVFQANEEDDVAIAKERIMREQAINDASLTQREYLWFRPQPPGLVFITLAYLTWIVFASPLSPFY
ncbi:MAG: prepilin peptidase [Candidatus Kariarchaeaceae archaeon]|jgi:Flp pilus assembly protein protease CpaA